MSHAPLTYRDNDYSREARNAARQSELMRRMFCRKQLRTWSRSGIA
jgi:hypothetical protein